MISFIKCLLFLLNIFLCTGSNSVEESQQKSIPEVVIDQREIDEIVQSKIPYGFLGKEVGTIITDLPCILRMAKEHELTCEHMQQLCTRIEQGRVTAPCALIHASLKEAADCLHLLRCVIDTQTLTTLAKNLEDFHNKCLSRSIELTERPTTHRAPRPDAIEISEQPIDIENIGLRRDEVFRKVLITDLLTLDGNLIVKGTITFSNSIIVNGDIEIDAKNIQSCIIFKQADTFEKARVCTSPINDDKGLFISIDGGVTQNFRVNNVGNVGIGTSTPTTQLVVPGSIPAGPSSQIVVGTNPLGMAIQEQFDYVVTNAGQLLVVDLTSATNPSIVATVSLGGPGHVISMEARFGFVGGADGNIYIVDFSNVANPMVVGAVPAVPGFDITALNARGRYMHLTATNNIFGIFDLGLFVFVQTPLASTPRGLAISKNVAYIVRDGTPGSLDIFDVLNPTVAPILVGTISTTAANYQCVCVQDNYAYVGATGMMLIFNITNQTAPILQNAFSLSNPSSSITSILIRGNYVFFTTANGLNTLQVVDISNPNSPTLVGTVNIDPNSTSICALGRFVYTLSSSTNQLSTFNMGGAYLQSLEAGNTESGYLYVRSDAAVGGDVSVHGSLFTQNVTASSNSSFFAPVVISAQSTTPTLAVFGGGNQPTIQSTGQGTIASTPLQLLGLPSAAASTALNIDGSGNVFLPVSSQKFKENIRELTENESSLLYQLRPVKYDAKPGHGDKKDIPGFIAEEVDKVLPSVIVRNLEGQPQAIAYDTLHALVIKEIQRHQDEILMCKKELFKQNQIIQSLLAKEIPHSKNCNFTQSS